MNISGTRYRSEKIQEGRHEHVLGAWNVNLAEARLLIEEKPIFKDHVGIATKAWSARTLM